MRVNIRQIATALADHGIDGTFTGLGLGKSGLIKIGNQNLMLTCKSKSRPILDKLERILRENPPLTIRELHKKLYGRSAGGFGECQKVYTGLNRLRSKIEVSKIEDGYTIIRG